MSRSGGRILEPLKAYYELTVNSSSHSTPMALENLETLDFLDRKDVNALDGGP